MPPDAFARLVAALTGGQPPRVWSLLVTVFGDLAQGEGEGLSGAALRALMEPVGITPQATRTALHRLKKDGWIDSIRAGRETSYALTAWGRSQSAQASPRIYAHGQMAARAWLLVGPAGGAACGGALPPGAVALGGGVALSPRAPQTPEMFASEVTAQTPLPDWMRAKLCDADMSAAARGLLRRLTALRAGLAAAAPPDPVQVAVLRVLIVHDWRRIALRTPMLPDFVMPTGWAGPECRAHVADLLAALETPRIAALEGPDRAQ